MCFNKEISALIYLYALCVSIKLFLTGRIVDGTLLLVYNNIQLAEFFIWSAMYYKSSNMNYYGSLFLYFVLFTQPLIIALVSKLLGYNKNSDPNSEKLETTNWIVIALYMLLFIFTIMWNRKKISTTVDNSSCRLSWNALGPYKLAFPLTCLYVLTFILTYYLNEHYMILGVFLGTLVIATIYSKMYSMSGVIGSMWCFLAALFSIVYIFLI